jgi:methyl-accepting chemotaxis protein
MNALHNLKLSHRFTVLISLFMLGFLVYGGWSFKTLEELKVNGPVYQRIVQGKDLIADILPPPEYIIESYLVAMQLHDATEKSEVDTLVERFKVLKGEYDTRHAFWQKENLESELADAFLKKAHEPATVFYATAFNEFIPAVQKQEKDAATTAMLKMRQSYEAHRKAVDQVVQMTTRRYEIDEAHAKDRIQSSSVTLLVILAVSFAAGAAFATVIARGLLKSLGGEPAYASEVTRRIAAGDLMTDVTVKDGDSESLLFAMKRMQDILATTVGNIKIAVDSVSTGAHEIASGNADLSQRTVEQATSLDRSTSSMDKLTATVRQNADNSQQASQLARSASEVAVRGGAVVSDVVNTMGSINESSRKIVDIISVIDGIAFQTNILALNAAVEAARAGEQGRGFAVVASEVRNLAQRSASAAKEIKTLIGDSVEKVDAGSKLVDQAGVTMNEVVESVKRVTDIINEISSASQEQSVEIAEINRSIVLMDEVTQQNAALVEQAAAAADSLQNQANHLVQVIQVFNVDNALSATTATPVKAVASRAPLREIGARKKPPMLTRNSSKTA